MKILKLLLLTFLICSFESYSQSNKLIGKWTLFFTDENVSNLDCKVCPTWEFKKDNTLIFTKPNGEGESLTWELDKDNMLSFGEIDKYVNDKTKNPMDGLKLKMIFTKLSQFTELRFRYNDFQAPMVLRKINQFERR